MGGPRLVTREPVQMNLAILIGTVLRLSDQERGDRSQSLAARSTRYGLSQGLAGDSSSTEPREIEAERLIEVDSLFSPLDQTRRRIAARAC